MARKNKILARLSKIKLEKVAYISDVGKLGYRLLRQRSAS